MSATEPEFLHLHLQAIERDVPGLLGVSIDGEQWFAVPNNLQALTKHTELVAIKKVTSAASACMQPPKYRRIKVPMTSKLLSTYFDEQFDFVIQENYLEEAGELRHSKLNQSKPPPEPVRDAGEIQTLIKIMIEQRMQDDKDKIEKKEQKAREKKIVRLRDLQSLFVLSKYDGKANAIQWLAQFEEECTRLEIPDELKAEALKAFLEESLSDWYQSNVIKLGNASWTTWKEAFTDTYTARGWSEIRSAYGYRHVAGSMVDYANAKERKLLEIDKDMPEKYRVFLIVVNLPHEIQAKIDRKTETFAALVAKLRECDDGYEKKKKGERSYKNNRWERSDKKLDVDKAVASKLFVEKKPCPFCEAIGFKNNFHRLEVCKNKQRYDETVKKKPPNKDRREVNWSETGKSSVESESDSSYTSRSDDEEEHTDSGSQRSAISRGSRNPKRSSKSKN